ncbi:MAG: hypothetical protein AAFY98_01805 [Verrucomicrobiota bacterium]
MNKAFLRVLCFFAATFLNIQVYGILDLDSDGTSDIWEDHYGADLPANVDSDGDGMLNSEEYARGTNPLVADSSKESITITGDETNGYGVEFSFFGGVARDFQLETIEDLNSPSWTPGESLPGADLPIIVTENMNTTRKFYRMQPLGAQPDGDGDTLDGVEESILGSDNTKADSDGDGMSDRYEAIHRDTLDPTNDDADLDSDGDGLTNVQEAERGTKPDLTDTDSDGVNDGEDGWPHDPNFTHPRATESYAVIDLSTYLPYPESEDYDSDGKPSVQVDDLGGVLLAYSKAHPYEDFTIYEWFGASAPGSPSYDWIFDRTGKTRFTTLYYSGSGPAVALPSFNGDILTEEYIGYADELGWEDDDIFCRRYGIEAKLLRNGYVCFNQFSRTYADISNGFWKSSIPIPIHSSGNGFDIANFVRHNYLVDTRSDSSDELAAEIAPLMSNGFYYDDYRYDYDYWLEASEYATSVISVLYGSPDLKFDSPIGFVNGAEFKPGFPYPDLRVKLNPSGSFLVKNEFYPNGSNPISLGEGGYSLHDYDGTDLLYCSDRTYSLDDGATFDPFELWNRNSESLEDAPFGTKISDHLVMIGGSVDNVIINQQKKPITDLIGDASSWTNFGLSDINSHSMIVGTADEIQDDQGNPIPPEKKVVLLLPIEISVVDRNDPKKQWGDEEQADMSDPIYAGETTGDMVSWKLGGTDSWSSTTFTWTAEDPNGETVTGPTGAGKNEWTIHNDDSDTSKDWLDWAPGTWTIKVQIGSGASAEFKQEVGIRTEQYIAVGSIFDQGESATNVAPNVVTQWGCPEIAITTFALGSDAVNTPSNSFFIPLETEDRYYVNHRLLNSTDNTDPHDLIKTGEPVLEACGLDGTKHYRGFSACQYTFKVKDGKIDGEPTPVPNAIADLIGYTPIPCTNGESYGSAGIAHQDSGKASLEADSSALYHLTKFRVGKIGQKGFKTINGREIPWVFFRFRFEPDDGLLDSMISSGPSSDPDGPDAKDYSPVPTWQIYRRYYDLTESKWEIERVHKMDEVRQSFLNIGTPDPNAPYVLP